MARSGPSVGRSHHRPDRWNGVALAAPSWLSRGMMVFYLFSSGVLADEVYYLTQRVGAYASSPNRS